jgi:DNA-binding HxlR family transcriptional regulator
MRFLASFALCCYGILHGFDRIRFRGTQRYLAHVKGLDQFLHHIARVQLKDFADYSTSTSRRLCQGIEARARQQGIEPHYVEFSSTSKEKIAAKLAKKAGRSDGLIAVLKALEPCSTFEVRKDHDLDRLALKSRVGKCLHYYHYWLDRKLGPCHVRLQTWFPFNVFVCVNGREMLAQRMTAAGMKFRQRDNCFSWIEDLERAQTLMDEQVRMDWSAELTRLLTSSHPDWRGWPGMERDYYWSAEQTEWASDVMFRSQRDLKALMASFIHHAMTTLDSSQVMKFLGYHINKTGVINDHFRGEVGTDMTRRPEGTRVAFRVKGNGVKFYDKQGSVLRVETTLNEVKDFKSYRSAEGEPEGAKQWRQMKKGVSDLPRRAEVSQQANERCLDSLASVAPTRTVAETLKRVSRRRKKDGVTLRALNVHGEDHELLKIIGRGEFLLNGLRNRDVRAALGGEISTSAVSYRLRLLRHHGVIRKVSGTHRYQVTDKGRELLAALTKAQEIPTTEENRKISP